MSYPNRKKMRYRFDGYLPVVVDLETGGAHAQTDALLEMAAMLVECDQNGVFYPGKLYHCHIAPFEGACLHPEALAINRIDPYHPFRFAIDESEALSQLFAFVREALHRQRCRRALLVGHNAHFDLSFLQAAMQRSKLKEKSPFHSFTVMDTATLSGLVYGKTVLAKALRAANIPFDKDEAHSAIYDTRQTTELFCKILNNQNSNTVSSFSSVFVPKNEYLEK
jgi:ribonuclease T